MSFISTDFLWFYGVIFCVYWLLPSRRVQNLLLVAGSALFYGWIHPWFLGLLYTSAVVDFVASHGIVQNHRHRRCFLGLSLLTNLGMLAYFKYADFFVLNLIDGLQGVGVQANLSLLHLVLPAGISFYTFQTMSYTIDVYRGELKPRRDFLDYLLYVSFFPQLVAGPIERAGRLLPQIEAERRFSWERTASGLSLALWGAVKKVCIADTLAPYVDRVFELQSPSGPLIWAATAGFMIQIYADFSGYTDIARGIARTLGFDLVENFRSPYLAASTPEFWQRWHMSLSFWIRDYVLAPLLGNVATIRFGRFAWAVMVTFVLIGLWHGASWNFVVFGLFHGVWMCIYTALERYRPVSFDRVPAGRALAVGFHLVAVSLVGSLIFREPEVGRLIQHLQQIPWQATPDEWTAVAVIVAMVVLCSVPLGIAGVVERGILPRLRGSQWLLPLQTTGWALGSVAIFVFYRESAYDFIYFQF